LWSQMTECNIFIMDKLKRCAPGKPNRSLRGCKVANMAQGLVVTVTIAHSVGSSRPFAAAREL